MKQRTTCPHNRYYIRKTTGGLNGAVAGKPTIKGANVLCNCVGYANGRFNEAINDPELKGITKAFPYQLVCNAENFIESARRQGLTISKTPTLGGIMVWQKGNTLGGGDGAGHVAFVEAVYTDGTITTSESGWNAWAFKRVRRSNKNGRWGQSAAYKFRGCIVNPTVTQKKTHPPKLKVDGVGGRSTVAAMQRFFSTPADGIISGQSRTKRKCYPALVSVSFGKGGSACIKQLQRWLGVKQSGVLDNNTVKAWQKKINVKADGVFGVASMKAWQRYLNTHDKPTYPTPAPKPAPKPTPDPKPASDKAAKIIEKAKLYCWPYGTPAKKYAFKTGASKPAYKTALKTWCGKRAKISQTDCGYFVNVCIRAAGLGYKFDSLPDKSSQPYPKLSGALKIVHKGKKVPAGFLKAGDVIRYKKKNGHQHTLIYYGNNKIAEAGRSHWFPAIKKDRKKYNGSGVKINTLQVLRAK